MPTNRLADIAASLAQPRTNGQSKPEVVAARVFSGIHFIVVVKSAHIRCDSCAILSALGLSHLILRRR